MYSSSGVCSHSPVGAQGGGLWVVPGFFSDFLGHGQALSAQTHSGCSSPSLSLPAAPGVA